jgi:hypothetical protein
VLAFLGLEDYEMQDVKPFNQGKYKKESETELKQELAKIFKPYNDRLYAFLGEDFGW